MIRLSSRYAAPTSIRQNRPLTNDELMRVVPSAFSVEKHESRSDRYTYIPTIALLDRLREEDSSRITPASHVYVIRTAGNSRNICCVYVAAIIFRVKKCRRFFY
jgi:hypothetical protein